MRFAERAYRAHDPRWSFAPTSGKGAAITGGRFNAIGQEALYLSLEAVTALAEATQGFANRMLPLTLCEYDVDCADVVDLTDAEARKVLHVSEADIACAWLSYQHKNKIAPSQQVAQALMAKGVAGALIPSFVPGIHAGATNLVLWKWGNALPHKIEVYDPQNRLPKLR